MRVPRFLVLSLVLAVMPGCYHGSNGTAQAGLPALIAATVLGGGRVMLDPLAARALLGTVTLQNTLAAGTTDGDVLFKLDKTAGIEPDADEVVLGPGQRRVVAVYTTLAIAALLTMPVCANYVRGGTQRDFVMTWLNETAASNALRLCELAGAGQLAALWYLSATLGPVGLLTLHSALLVPQRVPLRVTEIRMIGALLIYFSLLELTSMFDNAQDVVTTFPDGQGPNGFTIPAAPLAPLQAGDYIAFWLSTQEDIPIADPTQRYQYAFVVDSDGNPANNYTPSPNFPNDFFAGTDRWYELTYAPGTGWQLRCKVVGAGGVITTVASGARVILRGDTVFLFVPRSEFVLAHPPFRATSFRHGGDYGMNPPYEWSGDPTPTVTEGLHAWQ